MLDQALEQIPDQYRFGRDILVRTDSAGWTLGFLAHIRSQRADGMRTFFSVEVHITEPIRDAIRAARGWVPALDPDGEFRDGAEVCELTGLVPDDGYPEGTRFIVRRERPHPARNCLFSTLWRACAIRSSRPTPCRWRLDPVPGSPPPGPRPVEDRIRCGKDTGFGRFPSRQFGINQAWLRLALVAIDLIAWTQHLLLAGELAKAEPKKLRYRLLHVAARVTRSARQTHVRIAQNWPWTTDFVTAFTRLVALPRPAF